MKNIFTTSDYTETVRDLIKENKISPESIIVFKPVGWFIKKFHEHAKKYVSEYDKLP